MPSAFQPPALPGYAANKPKENNHKQHLLEYCNGYAIKKPLSAPSSLSNNKPLSLPADPFFPAIKRPHPNEHRKLFFQQKPATKIEPVLHEGIVFRFEASTRQNMNDDALVIKSGVPLSKYMIQYHLEDDTIQIVYESEGHWQLKLKRRAVPSANGGNISYKDLFSGQVEIFGVNYFLIGCDAFTKEYATSKLGLMVDLPVSKRAPPPEYQPPHAQAKLDVAKLKKQEDAKRFLNEAAPVVLRFYATWDDQNSVGQFNKNFEVRIYTSDDTFEILNELPQKDQSRLFLRRQRLPKRHTGLESLSGATPLGGAQHETAPSDDSFYSSKELRIGSEINVLGRRFILKGCDKFTEEFLSK